jgi:purine nucleoside permease
MVLRTSSNFTMQPTVLTDAENLAGESGEERYVVMLSALESTDNVESKVINILTRNWDVFRNTMPDEKL